MALKLNIDKITREYADLEVMTESRGTGSFMVQSVDEVSDNIL